MNTKRSAVKTTTRRRRNPASALAPLKSGLLIMLIDDDTEYLELLRRFLTAFDVDVHVCGDPELALSVARTRRPDLFILDYMMPSCNGFELVEQLRRDEELRSVPRVLMTGTPRAAALRDIARWDVHEVLTKPIGKPEFVEAIQNALGGLLPQKVDWTKAAIETSKPAAEMTRPGPAPAPAPDQAPAIAAVSAMMRQAVARGASDVHIEPGPDSLSVRLRVDGELVPGPSFPSELAAAVAARIKVMACLDIAERRIPQDGRFRCAVEGGTQIDVRVSTLPCRGGEKIVLRPLGVRKLEAGLDKLGLCPRDREVLDSALGSPNGLILVSGPTGSGKTTTLYRMLCALNNGKRNIVTVEDPIEYELPGVTQVAVNADIGLTFEKSLRAFLRQDPDIVLVGEIRDAETADIAARAAVTGRLVFSTIHTNDCASTVTRFASMRVAPYLLSAGFRLIVSQRLARALCPSCRRPSAPTDVEAALLSEAGRSLDAVYSAPGCAACEGQGYVGRRAVSELMPVRSGPMRELVGRAASAEELRAQGIKEGMRTLSQAAFDLVADGSITLAEALRVASFD